jgi:hypothetical protein
MIAHSRLTDASYVVLPLAWCEDCQAHRPALGAMRQGWRCLVCRTVRASLDRVDDVYPAPAPALELIRSKTHREDTP